MTSETDVAFKQLVVMFAIFFIILGTLAIGMYSNEHAYYPCTVTFREHDGPLGGHFYDVSCGAKSFTDIGTWLTNNCGVRVGDTVTVRTYGAFFPDVINGDDSC